jgi:phosphatidylglycerophosphate synthase
LCASGIATAAIHVGDLTDVPPAQPNLLLFRADYVFDERLIRALIESEETLLVRPSSVGEKGQVVAAHVTAAYAATAIAHLKSGAKEESFPTATALRVVTPTDLVPAYSAVLRKADPPYVFAVGEESIAEIENRMFAASYKGLTDLVTKFVWPRPAQLVVRWAASAGITPNMITVVSWLFVVAATWLFLQGNFGLGLVVAWVMTFLDTVDGKLARVTLSSSRIGHVLDHGLDILHPPFWYLAWMMGLLLSPDGGALIADSVVASWLRPAGLITVVGYIVGRLVEGLFMLAFKMEIHCWQPIDGFFRLITARRNPNLLLLSAATLCGRPDLGLVFVALWTIVSLAFHTVRLLQACGQRLRGRPVLVWQDVADGREIPRQWESVA